LNIALSLFEANLLSYGRLLLIPILLGGAIATYIYIPIVGKIMSIGLVSAAAALGAYQYGYSSRAALDQSLQLQQKLDASDASLKQARDDLVANRQIASDAAQREQQTSKLASDLQAKVKDYEAQLVQEEQASGVPDVVTVPGKCPKVRTISSCRLTTRDVDGLRAISGDRAGHH
jgi:hypothetical protein